MIRRWRAAIAVVSLVAGMAYLGAAAYIPAKAWLGQVLLEAAWKRRQGGQPDARPWPWADTTPLARLRQPRLGVEQIVLQGASGRVLAFGPGHITGSARPGERGNVVISAHRDTHFRWLEDLRAGDELVLETPAGARRHYAVAQIAIHHESEAGLLDPLAGDQLRLVTCYPFTAIRPGTSQRYVVTARPRTF